VAFDDFPLPLLDFSEVPMHISGFL
jgi:hypothetical protein